MKRAATTQDECKGLSEPKLLGGRSVTGHTTTLLQKENKAKRRHKQQEQSLHGSYWTTHTGNLSLPPLNHDSPAHRNQMCPAGLALHHPAASHLLQYAMEGCPVLTGKPWTQAQMEAAIKRGPHMSALEKEAIDQLHTEVQEKVRNGQARLVEWESLKANPPKELKISPIAMLPHKSRRYRTILDLSFSLRLQDGLRVPSVTRTPRSLRRPGQLTNLGIPYRG
jgi:hypothetical protein